ncbi:MAG: tetratricopeptide repeat protein [Nitrospira sp.]|nr:tetratricopeptide repeat protein [Nitrospira sp.]
MPTTAKPIQVYPPLMLPRCSLWTIPRLRRQPIQWLVTTALFVIILSCGVSASAEEGASEVVSGSAAVPLPAGRAQTEQVDQAQQPERPELPEALVPQITQGEQLIDDVIAQNKPLNAQQEKLLLRAAEELSQLRTQSQGEQWWETLDARLRLTDLRRWLSFTSSQRGECTEVVALRQQVESLYQENRYKEALTPAANMLDIDRRIWGEEHRSFAKSLNDLARLHGAQGTYTQAEPLYKRALAIREQVLGPTHPDTAQSLNNLAILYRDQGQYAQALPLYERALAIWEQTLGLTHPDTATGLNNLAVLYQDQGQYALALPLYERALAIWEQTLGPTHPNTAANLSNLARLYRAQGQYAKALPLLQRALAIREQVLGPTHPDTATGLSNLAVLYRTQGQYAQALPLLQRALAIREQVLGPTHPDTAMSANNLAVLYQDQGQYAQALPLYERALVIREQALGPTHPDTAMSLSNLADLHRTQGQYAQALPLYERALVIREQVLGPTHPDTAMSANNLGVLYEDQEQYAKALPLLQRALAIREQVLGTTHPRTATSLNNLADVYRVQGQYAEALPLYERALVIREQALGPTHPSTATSLNNLADVHRAQGQYGQAELLLRRALAIQEKVLGPEHPETANIRQNLGILRSVREPDVEAGQLLLQASHSTWRYLIESFPTLTTREQRQFLTKSGLGESGYLWHVLAQVPSVDRAVGYRATLQSKYLLAEATRNESGAFQRVLAEASAEWQVLWQEREALRLAYATQSIYELSDTKSFRQNDPRPTVSSIREIETHLEQIEQRLRRENPAYAQEAKLQGITVEQVQHALKPDQALLEYVQFHPYDGTTKQLAKTLHYGVFVVRGDQTPVVAVDLGDSVPIDTAIRQFHKEMQRAEGYAKKKVDRSQKQTHTDEATLAKASSILRELVWQPLEQSLINAKRVYVAPEGPLGVFPFEALAQQTKRGTWEYLVEEREIVYLNTGRDLARLALTAEPAAPAKPALRTAVLIGNPKFDAQPKEVAQVVTGLPHTTSGNGARSAREAGGTLGTTTNQDGLGIPRNWPQYRELDTSLAQAKQQLQQTGWTVTTWRDRQAVEAIVLRLQAPRILQFATHGYLLERVTPEQTGNWDNPLLRSMLLLAGVNRATPEQTVFYRVGKDLLTEAEAQQRQLSSEARHQTRIYIGDGILTAYEVSGMNLRGTELVNLTACKTGLGEVTSEGVVGLRQAFFFAGARALTTSLWEVPVTETTEQMSAFYRRWLGKGRITPAKTRYAAFRQTQLAALAQARKKHGAGHPFFWAGFIYLGDPGDLAWEKHEVQRAVLTSN